MAADALLKVVVGRERLVAERTVEPRNIETIEGIGHDSSATRSQRPGIVGVLGSRPRNSSHVPRTRSGWPVKSSR